MDGNADGARITFDGERVNVFVGLLNALIIQGIVIIALVALFH